ncbi:MAG: MBL fold metallo-hydrolase [Clostridia bacterium]|nr:MBL fold metallo-hydrolase [Clostridia bacterium]
MSAAVYSVERLDAQTFRIDECGRDNCYLLLGDDRALLIDCSIGTGDLAALVRTLTDLPLTVAATHGHGDHLGAGYQFEAVYVPKEDCTHNFRLQNTRLIRRTLLSNTMKKAGITKRDVRGDNFRAQWLPMEAPMTFDLGGRTVRTMRTPGHTAGSTVFLDEGRGLMFTGDHVCPVLPMHTYRALPLEVWLASAKETLLPAQQGVQMWCGHGNGRVTAAQLSHHIQNAEALLREYPTNAPRKHLIFYPAFSPDGCIHCDTANLRRPQRGRCRP